MPALNIPRVGVENISSQEFSTKYLRPGLPVIVESVLSAQPWSNTSSLCDFGSLRDDDEIAAVPAEISQQVSMDMHASGDYEKDLLGKDAISLMLDRAERTKAGNAPSDVLYTKIALNGCPEVLKRFQLETFLAVDETPLEPCDHPMLLAPGKFFYWVFVGEKGTFSKTHVDVMGSEAWLVVLSGEKEWVMVHPLDKHMVMDADGNFADLFDIDHDRFPEAKRARLTKFRQRVGDAIYVPSDAPHAVRNLEPSVSFTFNFHAACGKPKWERMMQRVAETAEQTAIVDIAVSCKEANERAVLRGYVESRASQLPTTDFEARCTLDALHAAFAPYGQLLDKDRTNAVPVGYDLCVTDNRVVYYYEFPWKEDWEAIFHQPPFTVETIQDAGDMVPSRKFASLASHFGTIPGFPPLSVLLRQQRLPMVFPMKSLASVIKECALLGNGREAFAIDKIWHYSRFAFRDMPEADGWCGTWLFYASPLPDGPLSLHPLEKDATLQAAGPTSSEPNKEGSKADDDKFNPHFERFQWDMGRLMTLPLGLIDLGEDLIKEVTTRAVLPAGTELNAVCFKHGLNNVDILECGIEKVMIPLLWFMPMANIVGFTYSHTFSTVREPNTLCLTGTAASALLAREKESEVASAMTTIADFIAGRVEGDVFTEWLIDNGDVAAPLLEMMIAAKSVDTDGEDSEEAVRTKERIEKLQRFL